MQFTEINLKKNNRLLRIKNKNNKYEKKKRILKTIIKDYMFSKELKLYSFLKLNKAKKGFYTQRYNYCYISLNTRSNYAKLGLSRNTLKYLYNNGYISGFQKAFK